MANTIPSELITFLYVALDTVSREMVGLIPAVTLDPAIARAALNEKVYSATAPAATATDVTPGVVPPDDGDQTLGKVEVTITKSRRVPIRWNGEQSRAVNAGPGRSSIQGNQITQAIRTLVNEMEADLALLYKTTSRAYGTAGTTPFATAGDYTDASEVRRILVDNGAPTSDLQLVLNTAAGAKFRGKQADAASQGSDTLLRRGVLLDVFGMAIRESAQIKNHIKGTGASYAVNNASNYAAGSTALAADTGTGTILAGDILTNTTSGRDTNKYVVGTALSAGSLAINAPGLVNAWSDNDTLAVGNSYAANMAFARSAIVLATRAPALPEEGDIAADRMTITDPVSSISLEVSMYKQYRQVQYEVAVAWGAANVKPEHTATLLG